MSMTIEQKMDIIQKAVEMGANIAATFYDVSSREEAEKISEEFSQMLDTPYSHSEKTGTSWFSVHKSSEDINVTAFYQTSREEKKAVLLKQLAELEKEQEVSA